MKKKELSPKHIELLVKLAELLKEYDASIECEDIGSIDVDMYVPPKEGATGFSIESVRLPDSFSQYEIGDIFEELGISKEIRDKMEAENPGHYDDLFVLPDCESVF